MPIYAYRCEHCGHAQDVLQKISDPLLTVCPACGQATYRKQVTAAGFQLKGSGWYVTDFRDNAKKPAPKADAGKPAEGGEAAASNGNGTNGHASNGNGANGNGSSGHAEPAAAKADSTTTPAAKPPPASPASA